MIEVLRAGVLTSVQDLGRPGYRHFGVATAGALDESLLFYLRARGLPEKEAQALLIQAFVGEAIEGIANDDLREAAMASAQRWLEARA